MLRGSGQQRRNKVLRVPCPPDQKTILLAQGRMAAPRKSRSVRRPGPSAGLSVISSPAADGRPADGRPADTPGVARFAHPLPYELSIGSGRSAQVPMSSSPADPRDEVGNLETSVGFAATRAHFFGKKKMKRRTPIEIALCHFSMVLSGAFPRNL